MCKNIYIEHISCKTYKTVVKPTNRCKTYKTVVKKGCKIYTTADTRCKKFPASCDAGRKFYKGGSTSGTTGTTRKERVHRKGIPVDVPDVRDDVHAGNVQGQDDGDDVCANVHPSDSGDVDPTRRRRHDASPSWGTSCATMGDVLRVLRDDVLRDVRNALRISRNVCATSLGIETYGGIPRVPFLPCEIPA